MIDFYKFADRKKKGEIDFVPDRIERLAMNMAVEKLKGKRKPSPQIKHCIGEKVNFTPRVFFDCYYERV